MQENTNFSQDHSIPDKFNVSYETMYVFIPDKHTVIEAGNDVLKC